MLLQAPINSLGYGIAGYNITKQLSKLIDITLYPMGNVEEDFYPYVKDVLWTNKFKGQSYNDEPELKVWHQNQLHTFVGRNKRVGFPIFELDKFIPIERLSMEHCDQLFVCSNWAKKIIENNDINIPVKVVPLGVDRSIFNENSNVSRPSTIFFNCGKWEIRKGHDVLLQAFLNAFESNDNVELWMMCENPFIGDKNNEWINYYKNSKMGNKIKIIPKQKTHKDVYNIMRQVDVGVFPVRAEGWNLELLELLSCGKNVITTNYSGHTEFTNMNNSNIVEIDELEPAQDGIWFHGQGNWAKIGDRQIDQISQQMKQLHKQKQNGELNLNIAGIETAIKFSWEKTAKEILSGI